MSYWHMPLKIGSLQLPRFIGGPLDGLTDAPFRAITRLFSTQALLYTEIRHVAAVVKMPRSRLAIDQACRPLNFQMTASSLEYIDQACEIVQNQGVDAVDLNIGCPAPNIVQSGSGSALMADPEKLRCILRQFRKNLAVPFTVKMRAGFKECNVRSIAALCQDCGVDAIVVHPRLQSQKFSGTPDYAILALVKKDIQIPVIVSGGIKDKESAQAVYEATGVDGFLIGRAQLGAPWLLEQMIQQVVGNEYVLSQQRKSMAIMEHIQLLFDYYGKRGLAACKRHVGYYVHSCASASYLRSLVQACECKEDLCRLVELIE